MKIKWDEIKSSTMIEYTKEQQDEIQKQIDQLLEDIKIFDLIEVDENDHHFLTNDSQFNYLREDDGVIYEELAQKTLANHNQTINGYGVLKNEK